MILQKSREKFVTARLFCVLRRADSLKQTSQLTVSQLSHKRLEVQRQTELQEDPPAHPCQILPSYLKIFSTLMFYIPQLHFREKQNKTKNTQKGLKYLLGKYSGRVSAMISVSMQTKSSLVFKIYPFFL